MAFTKSMVDFIHSLMDLVTPRAEDLNIGAMHYGDQDKLVARNTLCFEPDVKSTELTGANRLVMREFRAYALLYTAAVTSPEMNREESDRLAEQVEDIINTSINLGETVLHCMVTENASGYSNKNGTLVRSARLTIVASTRDRLP